MKICLKKNYRTLVEYYIFTIISTSTEYYTQIWNIF